MVKKLKEGECPHCGSFETQRSFEGVDFEDFYTTMIYPCECRKCGKFFRTKYKVTYVETMK